MTADWDEFAEERSVSRETCERMEMFVAMLLAENSRQNLISQNSEAVVWQRHILDSAQLLTHSDAQATSWLDVGAGAGLPGLVLAILTSARHVLVEPRRLRAEFLRTVVEKLGLNERVEIVQARIETVTRPPFDIITGRAFAALADTIAVTRHLANERTVWLLHKGRKAGDEVSAAASAFKADYTVLPSITAADAAIVRVAGLTGTTR